MPVPSPQPKLRNFCVLFRAGPVCPRGFFVRPGQALERTVPSVEKHETDLHLTEPEKRVIEAMRRVDYGELRVVMRNGKPVQLEATRSEKLDAAK